MKAYGQIMAQENEIGVVNYDVLECFACAIEYGDYSGLNDDEINQLEAFLKHELDGITDKPGYRFHHWTIDAETKDEFGLCEITRLRGRTVNLQLVIATNPEN